MIFRTIIKTDLPLMKNLLKPLAKRVFIPLGLTAVVSTKDAAIQRKRLDQLWLHWYSQMKTWT